MGAPSAVAGGVCSFGIDMADDSSSSDDSSCELGELGFFSVAHNAPDAAEQVPEHAVHEVPTPAAAAQVLEPLPAPPPQQQDPTELMFEVPSLADAATDYKRALVDLQTQHNIQNQSPEEADAVQRVRGANHRWVHWLILSRISFPCALCSILDTDL